MDLEHHTVNHSVGFIDHDTGIHTNHLEGTNFAIKRSVPIRNRTISSLPLYLLEFVWRRKNSDRLWDALIEALTVVEYD